MIALDMTPLGWLGRKTSTQTNKSNWLTVRSGCGILIYSAGQGLFFFFLLLLFFFEKSFMCSCESSTDIKIYNFTHQAPGSRQRRRSRRSSRLVRKALMEKNEGPNESLFSHTTVSVCASSGVTTGGNVSIASTGSYQDFAVCTHIV